MRILYRYLQKLKFLFPTCKLVHYSDSKRVDFNVLRVSEYYIEMNEHFYWHESTINENAHFKL